MINQKLPTTDSIEELALFWDTHNLTDFEDELEEVTEPVFVRQENGVIQLHLQKSACRNSQGKVFPRGG